MANQEERSPYGRHSLERIAEAENGNYYIQIGGDIYSTSDGKIFFSKPTVEKRYDYLMKELQTMVESGSKIEKADAFGCLLYLRIHPLRIH